MCIHIPVYVPYTHHPGSSLVQSDVMLCMSVSEYYVYSPGFFSFLPDLLFSYFKNPTYLSTLYFINNIIFHF